MASPHGRSLALDGIRGIAAGAVLLFHCGLHMHARWCVGHGSLAVDVFFCMSGYVLERTYRGRLDAGWPVGAFARARAERLYPLYAFGLALGVASLLAVHLWNGSPVPVDTLAVGIVFGALLIPSLASGPDQIFPLNGPSWSLFVEACLNLGFAAVPKRFGTAAVAAVVALSATVVLAAAAARMPLTYGGRAEVVWLDLARGGYGFGTGLLLARLERRRGPGALPHVPAPLLFVALAALLLVPRSPFDFWFDPVAMLLLCPALVVLGAASRPSARLGRWCAAAGALSYPLYVVHAPLIDAAAKLLPEDSAAPASRALALAVAAGFAVMVAGAIAARGASRQIAGPAVPASPVRPFAS